MNDTRKHQTYKTTLTAEDRQILAAATAFHRQRLGIGPQVSRSGLLASLTAAIAALFGSRRSGGEA